MDALTDYTPENPEQVLYLVLAFLCRETPLQARATLKEVTSKRDEARDTPERLFVRQLLYEALSEHGGTIKHLLHQIQYATPESTPDEAVPSCKDNGASVGGGEAVMQALEQSFEFIKAGTLDAVLEQLNDSIREEERVCYRERDSNRKRLDSMYEIFIALTHVKIDRMVKLVYY